MKVKKSLSRLFAAATILGATMAFDPFLYSIAQTDDKNILCNIDPSCRNLSPAEIDLAQQYFGNTIDYDRVRVFDRPATVMALFNFLRLQNPVPHELFGNIYYPGLPAFEHATPYQKSVTLHEITHVWQDQNLSLPERIHATNKRWSLIITNFSKSAAYKYDINDSRPFASYGMEQQAEIVENIYRQRNALAEAYMAGNMELARTTCANLQKHEEKAAQELPLRTRTDCKPD